MHTSGELPLDAAQKQAILDFVAAGNGFVGVHGASTINYEWAAYGEMLGAHFKMHPPAHRARSSWRTASIRRRTTLRRASR